MLKGFLKKVVLIGWETNEGGLMVKANKDCTNKLMQMVKYPACSNSEWSEGE